MKLPWKTPFTLIAFSRPLSPFIHPIRQSYKRSRAMMSTSASTSSSTFIRILRDGRTFINEAVEVARQVGPAAGVQRSLQAAKASADTASDILREVIAHQRRPRVGGATETLPFNAPRSLRILFERLGATYIKLGQFVASSPTLFPKEYVLEFQTLFDRTEPETYAAMSAILKQELGSKLDEFDYIDPVPIASASVAQVYSARLRTGQTVALKILKPGVEDTLRADLGFVYLASRLLEVIAPELARTSLGDIVSDIRVAILDEVDFRKERQNLEEFRSFLERAAIKAATCPRVYPELCTRRVLTMEKLDGVSLIDLEGIRRYTDDPEGTLIAALNTWTLSVVSCPSFHADLHSGNLLVLRDGRVGFIDFGIVGRLPQRVWDAMSDLVEGAYLEDYGRMAAGMIRMGATGKKVDQGGLARDLQSLVGQIRGLDSRVVVLSDGQGSVGTSVAIDEAQVMALVVQLVEVTSRYGLKLPREFGLLVKQILYLDRYTRILAPTLDPFGDARVQNLRTAESEIERRRASMGPVIDV